MRGPASPREWALCLLGDQASLRHDVAVPLAIANARPFLFIPLFPLENFAIVLHQIVFRLRRLPFSTTDILSEHCRVPDYAEGPPHPPPPLIFSRSCPRRFFPSVCLLLQHSHLFHWKFHPHFLNLVRDPSNRHSSAVRFPTTPDLSRVLLRSMNRKGEPCLSSASFFFIAPFLSFPPPFHFLLFFTAISWRMGPPSSENSPVADIMLFSLNRASCISFPLVAQRFLHNRC